MKKYLYLLLFAVFAISTGSAQTPKTQKYTLSGYVKDSTSGEYLIGTSVYIKELQKGVNCNTYGFYSVTIEGGNYTIITSFVGYKGKVQSVNLNKDQTLNIDLAPRVVETKEVVVSAQKADKNVKGTQMGRVEVEVEQIKT